MAEPAGFVSPGPAPGTAPAGAPPSQVGVRARPQGRPANTGVVPPPGQPIPPPGAGRPQSSGGGGGFSGSLRPAAPAPAQSGPEPSGGQTRMPTSPELDMMTSGMSAQLPVGTYTVGPDGQPQVILNEQGQAQYQARMERFAKAYRESMPPELRGSDMPIPEVTVGQRVLNPWTGQWITV